jgi:uncharacterized protein (TIGR03067 family)
LKELRGQWDVLVWDDRGYWMTALSNAIGEHYRDLRVTFTANRMIVKPKPGGKDFWGGLRWDNGYKLDPTKEPKEIDVILIPGEAVWRGIYAIHGDKLVICLHCSTWAKRPRQFETKRGGADLLLLLQRVKK